MQQEGLSIKVEDETYLKLEPLQKREKIFEALRDLLISVSQKKPLVIAIEDGSITRFSRIIYYETKFTYFFLRIS